MDKNDLLWPQAASDERTDAAALLAACRPALEAYAPEPDGGWLWACYDELTHRMFPDPARPLLPEAVQQGVDAYVDLLSRRIAAEKTLPYDPFLDVLPLTERELANSPSAAEYRRCLEALETAQYPALLRLTRQATPFDIGAHILGVHHVAVEAARQAVRRGAAVDLPLLSAAALTHDIGKFGCRGEDQKQMPLRHSHYSGLWLTRQALLQIERIAAHHSVWELEREDLPLESVLLIYADLRVRGTRENGAETVRIVPLAEAYGIIRAKILNKTEEKLARYERCFARLLEWEENLSL